MPVNKNYTCKVKFLKFGKEVVVEGCSSEEERRLIKFHIHAKTNKHYKKFLSELPKEIHDEK